MTARRKVDISVTVSWTTPRGGKVEGVRHTTVTEIHPEDVSDTLLVAGVAAEASFRGMLARYADDHREDTP